MFSGGGGGPPPRFKPRCPLSGAFAQRAPHGGCAGEHGARWDPGERPGCSSRPAPHTWIFLSFLPFFFFFKKALCRFWSCLKRRQRRGTSID